VSAELTQPGLVPDGLVGAVHVLAAVLDTARDIGTALVLVAQAVHSVVPSADLASLTLIEGAGTSGVPRTIWCSNVPAGRLDGLQCLHGQGPAVDVMGCPAGNAVLVVDMRLDDRWPLFGPAAARLGVGSVLSMSLSSTDAGRDQPRLVAAISLYAGKAGTFTMADQVIALPLAMQGAIAARVMTANQEIEQLRAALATRTVIGQAQGILMARYGLDAPGAFNRLRELSQNHNIKLSELAVRLAGAGSHPVEFDAQRTRGPARVTARQPSNPLISVGDPPERAPAVRIGASSGAQAAMATTVDHRLGSQPPATDGWDVTGPDPMAGEPMGWLTIVAVPAGTVADAPTHVRGHWG
jgi:ANTAR domain